MKACGMSNCGRFLLFAVADCLEDVEQQPQNQKQVALVGMAWLSGRVLGVFSMPL